MEPGKKTLRVVPTPFWLTKVGRNTAWGLFATFGATAAIATFVPHTEFISQYMNFVHLYENGEKAILSDKLKKRFEECKEILKIEKPYIKDQKPFYVVGFDVFHAGNAYTRNGSIIGIPKNYDYETEDDIDKEEIQIALRPVKWYTPAGDRLAQSLILTEDEQKFGICRELIAVQNKKLYADFAIAPMSVILVYMASQLTNIKFRLYEKPLRVRSVFYMLYSMFAFGYYCLSTDVVAHYFERDTDKKLCALGPKFMENGVKFYDKLLERNKAMRELSDGLLNYSGEGNIIHLFRQTSIPLTERKKFFETELENYKKNLETKNK